MAQSAVSAIRTGCQMLSEGKAEIDKFKKQVEGGVKDAKAIYAEVKGVWGWVKGLFGMAQRAPASTPNVQKPVSETVKQTTKRQPEPELSYEEYKAKAVHEIFEQLKIYFDVQRQLKEHCLELESQSSTTDKVADNAIDLIEIRWQMREMTVQVREAMSWTPESLGLQDLYRQFLQTYDDILEQQEFARQLKRKQEVDAKWRRELLKNHRIDRAVQVGTVLILVLWTWGFLLSLRWLEMTRDGLWLE
jgi:hypothetical protein